MSWRKDKEESRAERGYHHGNLKEALLQAALRLIAEKGPAGFTFADAARLAGVSPAAPGTMPSAEAVAAMMKYNEALKQAGVLITLDGLHPPSMGARISFAGATPMVTDGPFTEAKEVLGGYWMIEVKSRDEAIAWAKRCPASNHEIIEIRQVLEMSDFPADVQQAAAGFTELQARPAP